jgi:CheY-like chemotaxis protein
MFEESTSGPRLAGTKVLVVDDMYDMREVAMGMLRARGATVLGASSVDEALDLLQRERPDVLLTDIGMPGNGLGLIQRVRSLPPDAGGRTPAAAMTAFMSRGARQPAPAHRAWRGLRTAGGPR